jgi:hypothetical protein
MAQQTPASMVSYSRSRKIGAGAQTEEDAFRRSVFRNELYAGRCGLWWRAKRYGFAAYYQTSACSMIETRHCANRLDGPRADLAHDANNLSRAAVDGKVRNYAWYIETI